VYDETGSTDDAELGEGNLYEYYRAGLKV